MAMKINDIHLLCRMMPTIILPGMEVEDGGGG
jgi:hypothetical protein